MSCANYRLSFVLGLFLCCLLAACDGAKPAAPPVAAAAKKPTTPTYSAELQKLNAGIEHGISLGAKQTGDTLLQLQVVSLYQERARGSPAVTTITPRPQHCSRPFPQDRNHRRRGALPRRGCITRCIV